MSMPFVSAVAIILLLAANAFFVAAEFALVKARGFRIEGLAEHGSPLARMTARAQRDLESYLAACQLGITMASLGLGWIGEPAVAALLAPLFAAAGLGPEMLHRAAFAAGFILFSSLHIVLGEQVPKTFAIRKSEPVALALAYPLHAFYLLSYPLNWALARVSGTILSRFGVAEATHAEVLSDEEIRGLISTSREHGEIEEEKAAMLHNVFKFDQRPVERIMIPRSQADVLDLDDPAAEHVRIMRETRHSRFPVVEGEHGRVVGLLLVKDLYEAFLAGEEDPWRELRRYCREPLVVPETLKVARLFELMRTRRAHMAFAMDEYGEFAGLVTLEDLLEEIVGEISDELDVETPEEGIHPAGEDRWEAHGLTPLADVERDTGADLAAHYAANTLSGLFMECLERMPELGDEVELGGLRLRVTAMEERRVERVSIERLPAAADPPPPRGPADGSGTGEGQGAGPCGPA